MHTIVDCSAWPVAELEPAGAEEKEWLLDQQDVAWLYKPVVAKDGRRQGEDWAERIVSMLAAMLGVPAATVVMACRDGQPGCLSRNARPDGCESQPGAVLLSGLVDGFDPRQPRGHSIDAIAKVLTGFGAPPSFAGPEAFSAFDVFAGFLVLDAWVAHRDRHAENWSVLVCQEGHRQLMASYDHASSLGFNLTDATRQRLLGDEASMRRWVTKGDAYRFEGGSRKPLVDHALDALARCPGRVGAYWLEQLSDVTAERAAAVVEDTPVLSDVSRRFVMTVLDLNRRRLLDGWRHATHR